MNDILVVFISLLILTAILYYIKIYRDTYINIGDALDTNDKYSTLLRLESTADKLYTEDEQLKRDFNDYKSGVNSQISTLDDRTTQLQINTNEQIENIRKTHLLNNDLIGKFSSNMSDVNSMLTQNSEWTHIVYGEVLQTSRNQQQTIDNLNKNFVAIESTLGNNSNVLNTKIANITDETNTAFSSISDQLNANYDKTYSDLVSLSNNVANINSVITQANNSIAQTNNNIAAIKKDYVSQNQFQSSIASTNETLNSIKNDYVSKGLLTTNIQSIQGQFSKYPTIDNVAANYYPLKSGKTLESSIANMQNKVTNQCTTTEYVTKSMLANYYDKTGTENAIKTKLNDYVSVANGASSYYPLKSGQNLENSIKGLDTKISTNTLNAQTAITSGKLCLGSTCVDETLFKKMIS